jgi:glycosyltransferase involved in cell wall biosynthesis
MEAWRARQWEAGAWATVLRVETLSEDDATFVGDSAPTAEVFNGGAGVTIEVDPNQRRSEAIVPGRLIFWGNMSRAENVDAATYMARVLLPRIRARVAHAHLWIVGAHPTAEVEALRNDTVHVTGFVDDPAPVFYTASAAVAPIRLGSGVKIKVLETINAGIPTIASPVAREGIPPHRLLLAAETDDEFVDLVCQALQKME